MCIIIRGGASLSEPRIHEGQEAVLYVYIYILVCLWGDHFSEERVLNALGNGRHAHVRAL